MTTNLRFALAILALTSGPQAFGETAGAYGDAGFMEMAQTLGPQIDARKRELQRGERDRGIDGVRASYRALREGQGWKCRNRKGEEGFNRADLGALKRDRQGECMALAGASLSWWNLQRANLSAARMENADLQLAQLDSATLDGAWLHQAKLSQATLAGASLQGSFLHAADLTLAQLPGADLSDASLLSADLAMANLTAARLVRANLFSANLAGAGMERAVLEGARLLMADLRRARLAQAVLHGANLADADLRGAELDQATGWEDALWAGAYFNDETRLPFSRETALAKGMRALALPTGADLPRHLVAPPGSQ